MAEFLLEIGLEEIPARMIAGAEAELGRKVSELLTRERLLGAEGRITTYSTPRRLAVRVDGVLENQADFVEELVGPPRQVAYKDGVPTQAAIAFAKKANVAVTELGSVITDKGTYLCATVTRHGRSAADILASELPKEVLSIYWAKNMYWRAGKQERFVRPVRWLVALLDSSVVPLEIAGIEAGNQSRGHRILHGETPVAIGKPGDYLDALRAAYVEPDVAARRHTIRKTLDHVTRSIAETPGARWREDESLVETVVHLTEWPTVFYGSFEPEHLALPEEVLVTVMRDHQKYFAVEDGQGKLAPHFLTVLNTQVDEEGRAIIRHGNERVLRSRFKDAQFFWETDRKVTLFERKELLKSITFHKDLGNYAWKSEQNWNVALNLVSKLNSDYDISFNLHSLENAVKLAKVDLTTELVKEFTELQGIVGGLYARAEGLGEEVVLAIYDQYKPASTEDSIPQTRDGQLLGLADRIQTITAMFNIGLAPTGSKDPFALRRAANGIVKILAESKFELPLTLTDVVFAATKKHGADGKLQPNHQVMAFLKERLAFYLRDVRGYQYSVVLAAIAENPQDDHLAMAWAEALSAKLKSSDFAAVSAAFKRIVNILRQPEAVLSLERSERDIPLAPEAHRLSEVSDAIALEVNSLRVQRKYHEALTKIAMLRPVVDDFFDKVMVLDPDPDVRAQNVRLIKRVLDGFSGIADFSEIVVA